MAGSSVHSDSSNPPTLSRTLAIIKAHAIKHRFEIEARIAAAGFEIIKERQMGFHADDSGVHSLFGNDAPSLSGEPIWIYVLERRRAVEVWKSLMGPEDPEVARADAPDCLRALYGQSDIDNGVYGSPDNSMAELQINSIFASSPPFPVQELEADDVPPLDLEQHHAPSSHHNSARSASSSVGSAQGDRSIRVDVKSKASGFKARPVPTTTAVPSIVPKTTRAAALRAGFDLPSPKRSPASQESIAKTFENVPGHKRAIAINVASVAAPTIAPRVNRAQALRTGQIETKVDPLKRTTARQPNSPERLKEIFADVPGHKRRQTIAVASTAPPTIAPRPTRASALRTGQGDASPPKARVKPRASTTAAPRPSTAGASTSSRTSKPPLAAPSVEEEPQPEVKNTFEGVPGHKRSTTIEVASTRPPSTTPRINRSAALRMAQKEAAASGGPPKAPPSAFAMKSFHGSAEQSRSASQASVRQSLSQSTSTSVRSASVEPGQTLRSPSRTTTATPQPPSIVPRTNRSALLRASMGGPATPSTRKVFAF
ncbi:hypothetical protein FRC04_002208 [Tulasnella sp. 424]|nr:hypothetical protein FRC04_002208 [Tulasnella sp. 424]KAG8967754.1 hypothetical protein FRC05_001933 [Tulasnella sp. 425]